MIDLDLKASKRGKQNFNKTELSRILAYGPHNIIRPQVFVQKL